jgi:hypothetical protein
VKPIRTDSGGYLRTQDLESNWPVMANVVREVNRGRATASKLALERVPIT